MNLDRKLKDLQVALKQASWFSTEEHVDYDVDLTAIGSSKVKRWNYGRSSKK